MSENIQNGLYIPTFPPERAFFEGLWKYANPSGELLGGAAAVPFFQKSEVDTGILRQVWNLCTSGPSMSKEQFFTALRYITMVQNGDIPISKEKLVASAKVHFPPPKFVGVQLPPHSPPPGLPPPEAYAMTPDEKTKYDGLFKTYDADHSGSLPQAQAMPIFMKSGLDPQLLNGIWHLADHNKDGKLSQNEFAVAFHLILCVSKKRLPLPPGGLPPPLLALVAGPGEAGHASAPAAPNVHVKKFIGDAFGDLDEDSSSVGSMGSHSAGHSAAQSTGHSSVYSASHSAGMPTVPAKSPHAAMPVPAAAASGPTHSHPGASVGMSTAPSRGGGNDKDNSDLTDGVMALSDSAKKLHSVHQQSIEVGHSTSASLKYLLQRVATEKISLAAALTHAEEEVNEVRTKLESTIHEINGLSGEVEDIRRSLLVAYEQKNRLKDDTSSAQAEKTRLQALVEEGKVELARLHGESVETSGLLGQYGEKVTAARAENDRLAAGTASESAETAALKGELNTLRAFLAKLSQEKAAAGSDLQRLQQELANARRDADIEKDLTAHHMQELDAAKRENAKLKNDIESALKELAIQKALVHSAPPSQPVHVPAAAPPVAKSAPARDVAPIPVHTQSHSNDGFDSFGDVSAGGSDGFDSFGSPTPTAQSGFGDLPAAASSKDGFDDNTFGSTGDASVGHDAGFESFGADTTPTGDDGFGTFGDAPATTTADDGFGSFGDTPASVGDEGFGSFGDSPTVSADDGFGDGTPGASDGFGTFGGDAPASSATADDGFGAFGDDGPASSATADDGFGAFGDAPAAAADDGFGAFGGDAPASSATADDGFGAFGGDAPASSATADDGFGAFGGDAPASSATADDGFGTFGGDAPASSATADDGFGAFGDAPAAAADDGFGAFGGDAPASSATADDGFGAFGDAPAAAADDGFGAFGGDGFAAFGEDPPAAAGNGNDGFAAFGDASWN